MSWCQWQLCICVVTYWLIKLYFCLLLLQMHFLAAYEMSCSQWAEAVEHCQPLVLSTLPTHYHSLKRCSGLHERVPLTPTHIHAAAQRSRSSGCNRLPVANDSVELTMDFTDIQHKTTAFLTQSTTYNHCVRLRLCCDLRQVVLGQGPHQWRESPMLTLAAQRTFLWTDVRQKKTTISSLTSYNDGFGLQCAPHLSCFLRLHDSFSSFTPPVPRSIREPALFYFKSCPISWLPVSLNSTKIQFNKWKLWNFWNNPDMIVCDMSEKRSLTRWFVGRYFSNLDSKWIVADNEITESMWVLFEQSWCRREQQRKGFLPCRHMCCEWGSQLQTASNTSVVTSLGLRLSSVIDIQSHDAFLKQFWQTSVERSSLFCQLMSHFHLSL